MPVHIRARVVTPIALVKIKVVMVLVLIFRPILLTLLVIFITFSVVVLDGRRIVTACNLSYKFV